MFFGRCCGHHPWRNSRYLSGHGGWAHCNGGESYGFGQWVRSCMLEDGGQVLQGFHLVVANFGEPRCGCGMLEGVNELGCNYSGVFGGGV